MRSDGVGGVARMMKTRIGDARGGGGGLQQ